MDTNTEAVLKRNHIGIYNRFGYFEKTIKIIANAHFKKIKIR